MRASCSRCLQFVFNVLDVFAMCFNVIHFAIYVVNAPAVPVENAL